MGIVLFFGYTLLLGWLIYRSPFLQRSGTKPVWWLLLFIAKIAAGTGYGWFFTTLPNYEQYADTWRIFFESRQETQWLLHDPAGFLSDLFLPRYTRDAGVLGTQNSLLNDLKDVLMVKLAAVFNLLTGSRYYVNGVLYQFVTLWGQAALVRLWSSHYPARPWWLAFAGVVAIPSVLFWCSGFHRDGLILHAMGIAAWSFYQLLQKQGRTIPHFALLVVHMLLLFLLRTYLAVFFAAGMGLWWIWLRFPKVKWRITLAAASVGVLLFFTVGKILPGPHLPSVLSGRLHSFMQLSGPIQSLLPMKALEPTAIGFAKALPSAMNHTLVRPYVWELSKLTYVPAIVELLLFWVGVFMLLASIRRKKAEPLLGLEAGAFVVVILAYLIIGYTIPYLAAIIRYKAVLWPLLMPALLMRLNTQINEP